ncbi:MAG: 16S rRNA (cytidine(1402)-2'-O)-methyltransferase [Bacteroidota bacterium]
MAILYIVPTPIGNLDDITLRAIKILTESDFILAEDTRKTSILLKHLGLSKKVYAYHKFNEHKKLDQIVEKIQTAAIVSLVSDAGTPGISDPGFLLVRDCIAQAIEVNCLPGATALIPALVNSGLPCDKFVFEGFLPQKKGRETRLKFLATESRTMVFYESPHKLLKTLEQFALHFGGERKACVSRELTKIYEENQRMSLDELLIYYKQKPVKGEIVMVVEGAKG